MAFSVLVAVISISATGSSASKLMRLDLKDGKVIAEIPKSLIGTRLMMATRIEQTSDSGEGVAGQLSDNCIPIVFAVEDKELVINIPISNTLVKDSSTPGVWKRYKVTSFKQDSTAVVDLTDLFQTQYSQLHTFPVKAYNSMGGQVRRVHTLQNGRSRFVDTDVRDSVASVLCDFYYKMDGYVMGMMKVAGDYSVRAQVRKMIFLPSTDAAFPELEFNPAVAANYFPNRSIDSPFQPVNSVNLVRRWKIQPSDSAAWLAGEKVSPVKPIVFYVDTLMPKNWLPYVQEGILAWNHAFEQAGFTSVVHVKDFPSDPSFFSASPYLSRVLFAPSGMEQLEVGDLYDSENGEIFSAQICLHSNFIKKEHQNLLKYGCATSEQMRCEDLPDSIAGKLVRQAVVKAVGRALGIRNAQNKNKIELESIDLYNYLPGIYEQKVIAWLYGPPSCRSNTAEAELSELLIPSNKEIFEALDLWTANQQDLFKNLFVYFPDASPEFITSLVTGVQDQYAKNIVKLLQFIGGSQKTVYGANLPYPADIQRQAVKDVISHLRDMDWFKSIPTRKLPYSTNEFIGDVYRTNIFVSLVERFEKVKQASVSIPSSGYRCETFLKDIVGEIFGPGKTAKMTLMPIEMVWQNDFVEFLCEKMTSDGACYSALKTLRQQVYNASVASRGEIADHYAYLLFVIDKKLND